MSKLSRLISNNPSVPILGGAGLGALTPMLLKKLLNKDEEKYKSKPWHPLLGVLLGSGLGAGITYAGTNPQDISINKGAGMHSDFNKFFSKVIKEASEDEKIEIGTDKVNVGEFINRMQDKEEFGPDINMDEVPIIESVNPIPALYQDKEIMVAPVDAGEASLTADIQREQDGGEPGIEELAELGGEESLEPGIEELAGLGGEEELPETGGEKLPDPNVDELPESEKNTMGAEGFNEEVVDEDSTENIEDELENIDTEETKEAWNKYVTGMEDYLEDFGFDDESDREMVIKQYFGV